MVGWLHGLMRMCYGLVARLSFAPFSSIFGIIDCVFIVICLLLAFLSSIKYPVVRMQTTFPGVIRVIEGTDTTIPLMILNVSMLIHISTEALLIVQRTRVRSCGRLGAISPKDLLRSACSDPFTSKII